MRTRGAPDRTGPGIFRQKPGRDVVDAGRSPTRTAPDRGPSREIDRGSPRGKGAVEAKPADPKVSRERDLGNGTKRLRSLERTDPERAKLVLEKGGSVSVATDVATKTAIGVTASVAGGSGGFSGCFWDPCHTWPSSCSSCWNWWCSPGCSWWWSTCCVPWWGFGYWSGYWGCWYGYGGYYPSYPVAYSYPYYYPTVIYQTVEPAAQETVYVDDSAAAEPSRGEGSIQAAPDAASNASRGLQSAASHHLSLGDEAFRDGRYGDAVHEYAKAVELQPDQGVLHLILSDALFATGDYHYSAYALRRALELDPTLVDSVVDKHSFYSDPTEFDRQLDLLERYLGDHFLDEDARLLLGANYLFGAKPSKAIELLESPSSGSVRESATGKILMERARKVLHAPPPQAESPR
jgi:hypothetical protein